MILQFLRHVKRTVVLFRCCLYDFHRIRRHSSAVRTGGTQEKMRSLIALQAHVIEKGLALSRPRPGFGEDRVKILPGLLRDYALLYGPDATWRSAVDALKAYYRLCPGVVHSPSDLDALVGAFPPEIGHIGGGGIVRIPREEILAATRMDFASFCRTRHSVRQFSFEPPSDDDILIAIRIAQLSPSACNRQSCRVHIMRDSAEISRILELGQSAKGFAEQVQRLLIVTSNLACFQSAGERHQCWIDAGMFAMTLVYGLHSAGLVSCCINWSKEPPVDRLFRRVLGIVPEEAIVLLIAVGKPLEEFAVAVSARRSLEEILVWR